MGIHHRIANTRYIPNAYTYRWIPGKVGGDFTDPAALEECFTLRVRYCAMLMAINEKPWFPRRLTLLPSPIQIPRPETKTK